MKKLDFSKKIIIITGIIFVLSLIDIRYLACKGIDISSYATQEIITTGSIFGAAIIFYLNKSKIENLSKGKLRFILIKLRLQLKIKDNIPQENYDTVCEEIDKISDMIDSKLDNTLEDAINKDIDINNLT